MYAKLPMILALARFLLPIPTYTFEENQLHLSDLAKIEYIFSRNKKNIESLPTVLSRRSDPQSGIVMTVETDSAVRYESAIR